MKLDFYGGVVSVAIVQPGEELDSRKEKNEESRTGQRGNIEWA